MHLEVDVRLRRDRFGLSMAFQFEGSTLGVFGPSGSGKSTLFRLLAGLERPDAGRIILNDEVLVDTDRRHVVPPHKRATGMVFQDARLFPHWSVEHNLRAGARPASVGAHAGRRYGFDDVVALLEIHHLLDRSIHGLSGGEQQRVALGRALLSHPRLLLMDEPVSGLDRSLKAKVLPMLADVVKTLRVPTILISHDLAEIQQLTDHILLVREGSVVGLGALRALVREPKALQALSGSDLTNVLSARVVSHDPEKGTTLLQPTGSKTLLIQMERDDRLAPGTEIQVGIDAQQIALAASCLSSISMRNQLPATIDEIVHVADRSLCCLQCAAGSLFVEITPGTEQEMKLQKGGQVWALFKSMAVKRIGVSGRQ